MSETKRLAIRCLHFQLSDKIGQLRKAFIPCGVGDEAPAALKAFRKARRQAAGKLQTQDK